MASNAKEKPGGFSRSIFQNSVKALNDVNDKVYEIARELFTLIVDLTPSPTHPGQHAKGLLVNNWFPVNGPEYSEETTDETSPYGAGSLSRIKKLTGYSFKGKDGVVTLSNNLDYAYRAEVLGWPRPPEGVWSGTVGPYRMVALSLQKIAARYK